MRDAEQYVCQQIKIRLNHLNLNNKIIYRSGVSLKNWGEKWEIYEKLFRTLSP